MKDHRIQGLKKCTVCGREDGCRCYAKPPSGGSNVKKPCEHKYIHLETSRQTGSRPSWGISSGQQWKRVDRFFCEKCLDEVEKVKTAEGYEDRPEWW